MVDAMQASPEALKPLCDSNHQPTQRAYIAQYTPNGAALTSRKRPPDPTRAVTATRHPTERKQQQQGQPAAHEAYRAAEAAYLNADKAFIDEAAWARLVELARAAGARADDIVLPPGDSDEGQMIAAAQLVMLSKRAWEEGW